MHKFENLNAIELNKLAGMILEQPKPCKYGERMVQMTMDQGYLTLVIDKATTRKRGGREITDTVRRVEVWHFEAPGWSKITEAKGDVATESVLSFYVPDAQVIREKRLHHRMGGILTRDGYTVKSA